MLLSFGSAVFLVAALQLPPPDRSQAERLAREGQTSKAIELFKHIVEQDPTDTEARLWLARLDLRLGRMEEAEAGFRSVLEEHPSDVDARVGLGSTLTRKGAWTEALAVLRDAERDAGNNSDVFNAIAIAYRRSGDDRQALEYYRKAKTIAPIDGDAVSGFEATASAYGHSIVFDGFAEHIDTDANAWSGSLTATLRAARRLHLRAIGRTQRRSDSTDVVGGGGVLWRLARATTVEGRAVGGSGNTSLPTIDVSGEVIQYAGIFEIGTGLRQLSFDGVDVIALSPVFSWDADRWRLDTRYTYSRSQFDTSDESKGDHSVMIRETWRGWRRVWLHAVYAYGIESFEELTADRISSLGSTTAAAGVKFNLPSLTSITTTWEHEWRSNDTAVDRFAVSVVQAFP